jgi:glutamyl-tRNA synthetase
MGDAPYTIRFRVPGGATRIDDMVQGEVRFDNADFDDFVLVRPNGEPLFHLAVVADDGEMGITHVIRGDDHLTNAARHQMLFEALGYPVPRFAHLPMVLDETGKKYSKRMHGANVLDWRSDGFLAEALINYVALLGWTPREPNRELFTLDELVEHFEAARWGASAAKFDRKKLEWLNGQHIRRLSPVDLRDRVTPWLEAAGFDLSAKSPEWLARMAEVCQDKIPTLNAIVEMTDFFFVEPTNFEEKAAKKHFGRDDVQKKLETIYELLEQVDPFTHEALKTVFAEKAEEWGVGLGQFIHPTRLALTGKSVGPGLFELAELLGRKTCLDRVDKAITYVEKGGPPSS